MPIKYVIATLDPEPDIKEFFDQDHSTDRTSCDTLAREIANAEVSPCIDQGTCSYTVEAKTNPPTIIQFRASFGGNKGIDLNLYEKARQVHGDLVPKCQHHGEIGDLQVYSFEKLPGVTFSHHMMTTDPSDFDNKVWRMSLAESLAEFHAKAWNAPITSSSDEIDLIKQHAKSHLDTISSVLPPRYLPLIEKLKSINLFDGKYPIVPTHNDFGILNMCVESSTGKLTGMMDWAEASLSPFGYSLYGMEESCLGWMGPRGWTYYDWYVEVRDAFWAKFEKLTGVGVGSEAYEKIIAARCIGHLLRHGFYWSIEEKKEVCEPGMNYLDALLADDLGSKTGDKQ